MPGLDMLRALLVRLERMHPAVFAFDVEFQDRVEDAIGRIPGDKVSAVRRLRRTLRHAERRRIIELRRQAKAAA